MKTRACGVMLLFLGLASVFPYGTARAAEPPVRREAEVTPDAPAALEVLRDPFLPAESLRARLNPLPMDPNQFKLEAVLLGRGKPRALISGQVVGVGDPFYDYSVSEIGTDQVSLQREDREIQLHLKLPYEMEP